MSELKSDAKHEDLVEQDIDLEKPLAFEDYVLHCKRFAKLHMVDPSQYTRCLLKLETKSNEQRDTLIEATGGDQDSVLVALVYVSKTKHDAMVNNYRERLQRVTVMKLLTPKTSLACDDMSVYIFPVPSSPNDAIKSQTYWFSSVPLQSLVTLDDGSKVSKIYSLNIFAVNSAS